VNANDEPHFLGRSRSGVPRRRARARETAGIPADPDFWIRNPAIETMNRRLKS
jgi:hypothetical protein